VRRVIVRWVAAFALLALATVGAVAVVNATAFGAGSFVQTYLEALARGDAESALAMPGVGAGDADPALLVDATLAGLAGLRQTADVDEGGGVHRVEFTWETADGDDSGSSSFLVAADGTRFGLFPAWRFAVSPTATVALTVRHDDGFFVNELTTSTGLDDEEVVDYALFVPGSYEFGHESPFLTAETQTLVLDEPDARVEATIDVEANQEFVDEVQSTVDGYLDTCAEQQVLFPTGCPFGRAIENRVVSTPEWSIVDDPVIRLVAGETFGTWLVPATPATAHLVVDVQSLFDGSVSTLDEDVPFEVDYLVSFTSPTTITIEDAP
jgi:hypothetical protein